MILCGPAYTSTLPSSLSFNPSLSHSLHPSHCLSFTPSLSFDFCPLGAHISVSQTFSFCHSLHLIHSSLSYSVMFNFIFLLSLSLSVHCTFFLCLLLNFTAPMLFVSIAFIQTQYSTRLHCSVGVQCLAYEHLDRTCQDYHSLPSMLVESNLQPQLNTRLIIKVSTKIFTVFKVKVNL